MKVLLIPVPALPGWKLFVYGRSFTLVDPKGTQHSYEVKPGKSLSGGWLSIVKMIQDGLTPKEINKALK